MPNPAPRRRGASIATVLATLLLSLAVPRLLGAQQGAVLAGTVVDDERGDAVPGARVTLSSWRGELRTDSTGRFRLKGAPTGTRRLRIEAPGYEVLEVEVSIPSNSSGDAVYRLVPDPVEVERLEASAEGSPRMREFTARRSRSTGGRFLTRQELAPREASTLADVLRITMPGTRLVRGSEGAAIHLASRSAIAPGALLASRPCYAQIYVDGVPIYGQLITGPGAPDTPPDLGNYAVHDLEAVEYYSNPSSTPVEFRTRTATCGTLVLWTRVR